MPAKRSVEQPVKLKRFCMDMPSDLHTELKIYSIKLERTMGDIITTLVREFLQKK